MKIVLIIFLSLILNACHSQNIISNNTQNTVSTNFLALSNDTKITGSILIYDLKNDKYYSNDFQWAEKGQLPASTFKIPNSLIALELGIVQDEKSIFKWNGEQRMFDIWEQDLSFKQAFHYSCVPCYQEIAKKVNQKRMNDYIEQFNYGLLDINNNNIDNFWLIGESKITQFEQIAFLKKLYRSKLPVSKTTEQIFKHMFIANQSSNYILRAKTGLSIQGNQYNGWYVGYIESNDNVYIFATNISPTDIYDNSFNNKRKSYTMNALKQLGFIND